MKMKTLNILFIIFSLLFLVACGDKGEESVEPLESSNTSKEESEKETASGKTREQEEFDEVNRQVLELEQKAKAAEERARQAEEEARAAQESAVTITLTNGWTNYSSGYRSASVRKEGNLCVVSGLIKNGGWGQLAILSENCRPKKQLIFNLNNHASTARVDVFPNGEIHWVAGGQDHAWISLDGVAFSTEDGEPLALTNGWSNYDAGYRAASVERVGNLCVVSGLIKSGSWGALAMLPEECRPSGRLIFNLNNHASTARVDVLPSGEIQWVAGGQDHAWISLSGITFAVDGSSSLTLTNGWTPYSAGYRAPSLTREGTLCVVSGLIKGGNWSQLAMLPEECRPSGQLIFNLNNHARTARVDVLPNGEIKWVAGGQDHTWISLDGITFSSF